MVRRRGPEGEAIFDLTMSSTVNEWRYCHQIDIVCISANRDPAWRVGHFRQIQEARHSAGLRSQAAGVCDGELILMTPFLAKQKLFRRRQREVSSVYVEGQVYLQLTQLSQQIR